MNIRILINDVKDGDAIFVALSKEDKNLVLLIDAGRKRDSDAIIKNLDCFLNSYNKSSPDLVIGTHFDDDHIGGLLPVIQYYGKQIKQLWMFDTEDVLQKASINRCYIEDESMFPSEKNHAIGGEYGSIDENYSEDLITSIKKEKEILQYSKSLNIPVQEPIAGKCFLPGWPEIKVLGPTLQYYNTLFPLRPKEEIENEEISNNEELHEEDLCGSFNKKKSPVSKVNLNSVIIKIAVNDKIFLFTADAGIDSFYEIPDYRNVLSNIYWLKIPHHGSGKNINNDILDIMQPKFVAISGNVHISDNLISCMRAKGISVSNTRDNGSFTFPQ